MEEMFTLKEACQAWTKAQRQVEQAQVMVEYWGHKIQEIIDREGLDVEEE